MGVPGDLVDHPTVGPPVRDYLSKLFTNWRVKGAGMMVEDAAQLVGILNDKHLI